MSSLHHTQQSDEELMVLIQNHRSESAWVELHARYSKKLLGFFIKMLQKDVDLAQDFVQELFLKLLEKNHQFDPTKKCYSWIFAIANNMCKTAYRHQGKTIPLHEENLQGSSYSENLAEKSLFLDALQKSIDQLEHHHKTVFVLRFLEHLSLNEIAEITETSLGTVKSRLFYATKNVTDRLKSFDPTFETLVFKLN